MNKEALKLALESLERVDESVVLGEGGHLVVLNTYAAETVSEAITVLREALAAPVQEPVARFIRWGDKGTSGEGYTVEFLGDKPLPPDRSLFYTSLQPAQPLTDEQIEACIHHVDEDGIGLFAFARAIEAAHGITKGNT